jgi:hypothetical protein
VDPGVSISFGDLGWHCFECGPGTTVGSRFELGEPLNLGTVVGRFLKHSLYEYFWPAVHKLKGGAAVATAFWLDVGRSPYLFRFPVNL